MNLLFGSIASVSLLVGGIGISASQFISKEFGWNTLISADSIPLTRYAANERVCPLLVPFRNPLPR